MSDGVDDVEDFIDQISKRTDNAWERAEYKLSMLNRHTGQEPVSERKVEK
jgi:hypothetical protein